MTQPRNVRPGVTWLVTSRTTRRFKLFSPDAEGKVEQIYWYATGVYARKLHIEIHVTQLMSTHPHEVLTDVDGKLPRFFELRNRAVANAIKVLRGWPEEVFSKTPANWVELPTAAAAVKEMAYTMANCVAAGLVRTPRRWPGAKVLVDDMGRLVLRVKRPEVYFSANNPDWPDEIDIPIVIPQLLKDEYGCDEACRAAVQAELDRLVKKAHADNKREGRGYLGAKRVLKTKHTSRASSYERFGSRTPTFAAAGNREVAEAMVEARRAFHAAYRKAWRGWRDGDRKVVFPYGTWKMRVYHAALCHPPP